MGWRPWVAALSLLAFGCGAAPESLPAEMIGIWRTDNPILRESYFELREDWVVFGADRFRADMHPIRRIESERAGASIRYEIEYTDEAGDTLPLHLVFTPGRPPTLRVGQRPDAWVPESAAHWLSKETS